jgi:hypothetical protein
MGSSSRVFSAAISAWLTASHPNSEVKQVRAGVVLRWGTTREGPVLRFLFSLSPSPPFVSLSPSPPSPSLDFCSRVSSSVCRRTLRAPSASMDGLEAGAERRLGPKVERARPEACLPVLLRGCVLLCTSTHTSCHTSLCALHCCTGLPALTALTWPDISSRELARTWLDMSQQRQLYRLQQRWWSAVEKAGIRAWACRASSARAAPPARLPRDATRLISHRRQESRRGDQGFDRKPPNRQKIAGKNRRHHPHRGAPAASPPSGLEPEATRELR